MPAPFDPDKYLAEKKAAFDPDAYLSQKPVPREKTIVEDDGDYLSSLKNLPSYTVGSIPVLGPALTKSGAAAGAALKTIGGTPEEYTQAYQGALDAEKRQRAEFEQQHPTLSFGGGVVGSAMLPIPGAIAKAAPAAAPLLRRIAPKMANIAAQIGVTGVETAADSALRDRDAEESAMTAMGMQAGLMGLIAGVGKVAGMAPRLITGVTPQAAKTYKSRAPEIRAESEEGLIRDIQAGRERAVVEPIESAKNAAKQAAEAASDAKMIYRENLKGQEVPPELTKQVFDGTKEAKKVVYAASSEGFDALAASGKTIPTEPMLKHLDAEIEKMQIGGKIHPSDMPTINALQQEREFLAQFGPEMNPVEAKKLIQTLDRMEERAWDQAAQAGGHVSPGDKALINYRRTIDGMLKDEKNFPEYKKAMEKASSTVKALDQFRNVVGKNEPQIERSLKSGGRFKEEAIRGIEQATGKEYLPQLGPVREAQEILRTPRRFKEEVSKLPESQAARAAEEAAIDAALWGKPVQQLGDVGSIQSAVRRVESTVRPDYKSEEALKYLGELTGDDYLRRAENLAIQRGFNMNQTRGSRNVMMGGNIGGFAGKLVGAESGGRAVGSALGYAADVIGTKQYQRLLDLSMKPGVAKTLEVLDRATQRGPQAVSQAIQERMSNDPDFARIMAAPAEER